MTYLLGDGEGAVEADGAAEPDGDGAAEAAGEPDGDGEPEAEPDGAGVAGIIEEETSESRCFCTVWASDVVGSILTTAYH